MDYTQKANSITLEKDNTRLYISQRPRPEDRLFKSDAIEEEIRKIAKLLKNAKLRWMFENAFPNTVDTTVRYYTMENGEDDTLVYTGDIHAMWLRDSGAQVWPYIHLASKDEKLKKMLRGTILRQFRCIILDPYANAFLDPHDPNPDHQWMSDKTDMKLGLHERKWEIDSLCYPLRLAYQYWKMTGDASIFGEEWKQAITMIIRTFKEQQKKVGHGPYTFQRKTERQLDTMSNNGMGNPVKPVGLIASAFRPSDDATTFQFLIPSNFFAVTSLHKASEILTEVNKNVSLAKECTDLANEVEQAVKKYAVCNHPKYGKIYAFEIDGFGNQLLMDDANVPSLLALPYLGDVDINDPVYQNTRSFVWSEDNPYFFKGKAGEGIGGPHVGYDMIWPMSIMMKAFTSQNDEEIRYCIKLLMTTDAGSGFMHESFHKDNPKNFTREWFAWQNTLFGELIIKLINEGKLNVLNSL
ncbi:MAG: metal-independent alpha-mannosidase [Bacteroidales bacterium 45-6]|nr:MAG: metal-independent alpha-mannosidase [Bacteroidales bacterium 45-6]